MPPPSVPLEKLGFLTIGSFDGADPGPGTRRPCRSSSWASSSASTAPGCATGTCSTASPPPSPCSPPPPSAPGGSRWERPSSRSGWENPLRLAEDLATVDILSGGRLNPGVSVGPPMRYDDVRDALYPDTADVEDFSYERVLRLLRFVARRAGQPVPRHRSGSRSSPTGSSRTPPACATACGTARASLRSAQWAGENGLNYLSSNVVRAEESEDFAEIQRSHLETFRAHHPAGAAARASQGLVVIPTDSATPEQAAKYAAYAQARTPRTATPQGPARMMFARDVMGTSDQIAEALYADPGFRLVREVVFALPFSFDHDDYVQILTDIATKLGPALGWRPAG